MCLSTANASTRAVSSPATSKSLADLKNLPFTEKQDLRNYYPFGLFAVPRDNIVRLHASSGTTGKAVVVGYTARDLHNWAELAGRSLSAAGVNQTDIVHVAYGYGLFTGGLGAHGGAERIGATVVPASGGATRRQAYLLRDFGATALCCTPSYALHLWEAGQEVGIDFRDLPLRTGVFGAEPWTEEMRQDIEQKMGINALNIYGLSEVMGPGVAMECLESKCGMHLWEDHFLPEIIDPVTGEQLPEGEVGELVITTLTKCKDAPAVSLGSRMYSNPSRRQGMLKTPNCESPDRRCSAAVYASALTKWQRTRGYFS